MLSYKNLVSFYRTFTVLKVDGVDRYGGKNTP